MDGSTANVPEALDELLARLKKTVRRERRTDAEMKTRIRGLWGEALGQLAGLLHECRNVGEQFLKAEYPSARLSNDLVFFANMHLHAHACLTTNEILTLLEAGYSIGAMARWRTLHEAVVYATFIAKHGPATAERYLRHAHIKDCEDLPSVDTMLRACGDEGFSAIEIAELTRLKSRLLDRYGNEFTGGLEWAKAAHPKKGGLAFKDIAADVGFDQFDTFYRVASHSVHPTWKGIVDREGLPSHMEGEALLAGPSEYGVWQPAMLTTRSIYGATVSFLTCRESSAA